MLISFDDQIEWSGSEFRPTTQAPAEPEPAPRKQSLSHLPHAIVFDIETGPLPPDELWKIVPPFDPATLKEFPAFDPASVKYGNIKEEAKRLEKFNAVFDQYQADAAAHAAKNATAKDDYERAVIDRAALDPTTGRVLAIGMFDTKESDCEITFIDGEGNEAADERSLLRDFWSLASLANNSCLLVGHNITGFDLPFLIRRSWLLGVEIPPGIFTGGRFFAPHIIDTMRVWACGNYGRDTFTKLDTLAKAFGLGAKNGNGAEFAALWATDRTAAAAYLRNDLELTWNIARRMRICQ